MGLSAKPVKLPARSINREEAQAILDAAHVKSYDPIAGKPNQMQLEVRAWNEKDKNAGIVDGAFWAVFKDGEKLHERFRTTIDDSRAAEKKAESKCTKARNASNPPVSYEKLQTLEADLSEARQNVKHPDEVLNAMFGQKKLFHGSGFVGSMGGDFEYTFDATKMKQLAQGVNPAAGTARTAQRTA